MSIDTAFYRENGYCIARNLLPRESVGAATSGLHALMRDQLALRSLTPAAGSDNAALLADMRGLLAADQEAYLSALRLSSGLMTTHDALLHPRVREAASELGIRLPCFNTGPVLHVMSEALRIPGGYFGQAAHQDFTSTQASLNAIIVWIPLTDIDSGFYPLEVVPGSHKQGIVKGEIKEHYYEISPDAVPDSAFVPVSVARGDVVFASVFTVHRTGLKGREGVRISTSIRYEDAREPTYAARGYPNAYKRSVDRRILHPGFPSAQELEKVFSA